MKDAYGCSLRLLPYFLSCGTVRKFHKGSKLGAGQPNITRSMNRLEEQLGCKLFRGSVRGVELTQEDERLMAHMEIAYRHLREAEEDLTQEKQLKNGPQFAALARRRMTWKAISKEWAFCLKAWQGRQCNVGKSVS